MTWIRVFIHRLLGLFLKRKLDQELEDEIGVNLRIGREFSPQEDQRGGNPVVIISDRLWRDRFAGNPEALLRSRIR